MTIAELHKIFLTFPKVSTDTRKITKDCIFFSLKGDNFNGNKYAKDALEKGARYAVVDEAEFAISENYVLVENVLQTLQKLATFHRNYCNAKIIALTGSNGKTTSKELINAVLSKRYNTIATIGNLNNHIGVPLTLLSILPDTEIAVVEMGANHLKEIEFLCKITAPDFGYITNFGKAHLEGFGGVEGVIKGKSEMYSYLTSENKPVFMNADDPIQLTKLSSYINKFGFSETKNEFYSIKFIEANPYVHLQVEGVEIRSQLIGSYNFTNSAAAVLMGKYFNISLEKIKDAIESYIPENNRSQILERNGYEIILDAYNANPTSMKAALENFKTLKGSNKTAFLGDMFELGESAANEHEEIANLAATFNFNQVYLVGENFANTNTSLNTFKTYDDLLESLRKKPLKNQDKILIKGSRGMALERLLDIL